MQRLAADLQNLAAAVAALAEWTTAAAEAVLGLAADLDNKVGNLVAAVEPLVVGALLVAADIAEPLAAAELDLLLSLANNQHY